MNEMEEYIRQLRDTGSGMLDFLPASEGRRREAAQTGKPVPPNFGEWWKSERQRKGTITAPDILGFIGGETPSEAALGLVGGVPGKALKLGLLGLSALGHSGDAEATTRRKLIDKLRGREGDPL
jgi:hypothetical protein